MAVPCGAAIANMSGVAQLIVFIAERYRWRRAEL